jgi:nucleoside 2-deoxyribosyltransferase
MNNMVWWFIVIQLVLLAMGVFEKWNVTSSRPIRRKRWCLTGIAAQFVWLVVFIYKGCYFLIPQLLIDGIIWYRGYKKAKWISEHNRKSGYRIRLYMSHPIRGSKHVGASLNEQLSNSQIAKDAAFEIMMKIDCLDIYTPGNAEDFVGLTYSKGLLTDTQILALDCEILEKCDGLMCFDFDTSKGVEVEVAYAKKKNIPMLRFREMNAQTIDDIEGFVNQLINKKFYNQSINQSLYGI